jgi:dTDP-4-dehydrorhamnose reductase
MNSVKALVLGAGGMAGHVISLVLLERGFDVTCVARRELPFCNALVMDVRDERRLSALIADEGFDVVVNAVGILQKGIEADPSNGIWINSYLPRLLSETTKGSATRIIHLSTDCVFSGHGHGGYKESSFRSADDLYGRSKALGEIVDDKNLTIRTSIVGPDINRNGTGLFNWFMQQEGAIKGYTNAIWTGVTTIVLARAIDAAIRAETTGLYHLVNNAVISKFDLLGLFNRMRLEAVTIEPDGDYVADKSLVDTRHDLPFDAPSYEAMVEEMRDWMLAHSDIYGHYIDAVKPQRKDLLL